MPPKKLTRPFKAPRQASQKRQKRVEKKQDSDDDEDNVPFSALKTVITNADKPQPIEYVGEVWKDKASPFVLITDTEEEVSEAQRRPGHLRMLSEREADETAKFGEVLRWSSDSDGDEVPIMQTLMRALKEPTKDVVVEHKDIGMKIARDFGVKGVFVGKVVAVEYDSEDVDKIEDIYVVEYTDGDREDINKEELGYANEFYVQVSGLEDDTPEGSLHTESVEEECYVPSPPVCLFISSPLYIIPFIYHPSLYHPLLISSPSDLTEEKKPDEVVQYQQPRLIY